jgi:hypothetical protein
MLFPAFIAAGCSEKDDADFMRKASEQLVDVLWNVDYHTFTPEKTTAFARKYYDSDFLSDYESDILYNAGVASVVEEKLISKVLSLQDIGQTTEELGDSTYQKYAVKAQIEIVSYKPLYPEDSVFEEGQKYDLIFSLYFMQENGTLKLSAFGYEPETGALLPKRANNVTLSAGQKKELESLARQYAYTRYNFDYKTYDPKAVFSFYENNTTKGYRDMDDISLEFLNDFYEDIKSFKMQADVTGFEVLYMDENKTPIDFGQGVVFYYLVAIQTTYKLSASKKYFEETQTKGDDPVIIREILGFEIENEKPKIAFVEYE